MVIIQGCNSLGFKVNLFIIWSGGIVSKFLSITIENGNSFIAFFVITNDDFNRDSLQEAIENGAVVAVRPFHVCVGRHGAHVHVCVHLHQPSRGVRREVFLGHHRAHVHVCVAGQLVRSLWTWNLYSDTSTPSRLKIPNEANLAVTSRHTPSTRAGQYRRDPHHCSCKVSLQVTWMLGLVNSSIPHSL